MNLDFEWPRARYELRPGYLEAVSEPKMSRPKGEALASALTVLVEIRKIPFEQVALKVANSLGMLDGHSRRGDTEDLQVWINLQSRLKAILLAHNWDRKDFGFPTDMGTTTHVGTIDLHILPNPDAGPPILAMRPKSLGTALEAYAAERAATGTEFATCENCGTLFLRGGGRGSQTKKKDSRFCEPRCKSAFHNERNRA